MEKAIAFLCEHFQEQPSLADAAKMVGFSDCHFQRTFQHWVGVSPKQFLQYLTADYARQRLQECKDTLSVTEEVGLSSGSRLHDLVVKVYAATPAELKNQGANLSIRYGWHDTPFGLCAIALSERGICHLSFPDRADNIEQQATEEIRALWPCAELQPAPDLMAHFVQRIFCPGLQPEELKVHLRGSPFQIKVWAALLRIPPSRVVTYQEIARRIGQPRAYRAAATAISKNPIGFLIPCHRVIRQSGIIGDYRWGSNRKRMMLGWEAAKRGPSEQLQNQTQ
jgi:AraC family transcriptional regulator of adaptative response/methylated-DNA-[protein]-cysteine methyltransferase